MKFELKTSTVFAMVITITTFIYLIYNIGIKYLPIFTILTYIIIYFECYWNKQLKYNKLNFKGLNNIDETET